MVARNHPGWAGVCSSVKGYYYCFYYRCGIAGDLENIEKHYESNPLREKEHEPFVDLPSRVCFSSHLSLYSMIMYIVYILHIVIYVSIYFSILSYYIL